MCTEIHIFTNFMGDPAAAAASNRLLLILLTLLLLRHSGTFGVRMTLLALFFTIMVAFGRQLIIRLNCATVG